MHKLYSAKYILISDGSNDIFASDLLFLEGEPTKHLDSFGTFYEFYDAVASCKYPWYRPGTLCRRRCRYHLQNPGRNRSGPR